MRFLDFDLRPKKMTLKAQIFPNFLTSKGDRFPTFGGIFSDLRWKSKNRIGNAYSIVLRSRKIPRMTKSVHWLGCRLWCYRFKSLHILYFRLFCRGFLGQPEGLGGQPEGLGGQPGGLEGQAGGRDGKTKEQRLKSLLCGTIGHRPLRGRCPKRTD